MYTILQENIHQSTAHTHTHVICCSDSQMITNENWHLRLSMLFVDIIVDSKQICSASSLNFWIVVLFAFASCFLSLLMSHSTEPAVVILAWKLGLVLHDWILLRMACLILLFTTLLYPLALSVLPRHMTYVDISVPKHR